MGHWGKAFAHKGFEKIKAKTRYHTAFEAQSYLYLFFAAGKYFAQMPAMAVL